MTLMQLPANHVQQSKSYFFERNCHNIPITPIPRESVFKWWVSVQGLNHTELRLVILNILVIVNIFNVLVIANVFKVLVIVNIFNTLVIVNIFNILVIVNIFNILVFFKIFPSWSQWLWRWTWNHLKIHRIKVSPKNIDEKSTGKPSSRLKS